MVCKYKGDCGYYSKEKYLCAYGNSKCEYWREFHLNSDKRRVLRSMILESEKVWKNCVRFHNSNESLDHFLKKSEIAHELISKRDMIFWCEVKLIGYPDCKPDIVAANKDEIIGIEILKSEPMSSFELKMKKYPKNIDWSAVKV